MRLIQLLLLSTLCTSTYAATQSPPAQSAPAPLAPDAKDASPDEGPQVTITKQSGQTIEEYRVGGRLYMIKVIPKHGKPYYLVDDRGDGRFARQDSLDSGVRVPRWVIHKF
jgi:hypothetical protein